MHKNCALLFLNYILYLLQSYLIYTLQTNKRYDILYLVIGGNKMNNLVKNETNIENLIYEVRGVQVMLDSDLAKLYECSNGTKSINLVVKRHINRFPERFMFQLTKDEYYNILRFQSETLELEQGKYSKYLPFAFTEQGVAMLATVIVMSTYTT